MNKSVYKSAASKNLCFIENEKKQEKHFQQKYIIFIGEKKGLLTMERYN